MIRHTLNELNKVTLAPKGFSEDNYYTAWLTNPVALSTVNNFVDIASAEAGLASAVITNIILGKVPAFSMDRKFAYRGASPIGMSLQTMLKLKESPEIDFVKPLSILSALALPTKDVSLQEGINGMVSMGDKGVEQGNMLLTALGLVGEGISQITNFVADHSEVARQILEDTYFLNKPRMLDSPIDLFYGASESKAAVRIGPFLIKGINVVLGKLIMSGGLPEVINVQIDLEAYRTTDKSHIADIFINKKYDVP